MRIKLALFAVLALAGCGSVAPKATPASYDLAGAAVAWQPERPVVRGVGVFAPSWLGSTAIAYRLVYADPWRRQVYAHSRWTAPPAELIERALNRQTPAGAGACRLRLDVDDLAQVFDTPQASRLLLDVRAALIAPDRSTVLARKAFSLAQPASSADARGGVAATAAAVAALGFDLGNWLGQVADETPAIAQRCRGG